MSKISLEDFLSQENLCHWTKTGHRKEIANLLNSGYSTTKYLEQHSLPGEMLPNHSLLNELAA